MEKSLTKYIKYARVGKEERCEEESVFIMSDHICWLNRPRKKNWILMQISRLHLFSVILKSADPQREVTFSGEVGEDPQIVTPSLV